MYQPSSLFPLLLLWSLCCPSECHPQHTGLAAGRRNVLFLLADDGGFESSVFNNSVVPTPSLARLARRGTVFDRAFTAVSSCSPSRSAILSGLPTHQNGMYGLHQYPGNFQSSRDVASVVNLLNEGGYKTGILGKHHVGPLPSYAFQYGASAEHCWAAALGNSNTDEDTGCHASYNEVTRNLTTMKANARSFLRLEPDKPFLLYVGWGDCHRCGYKSQQGSFCEFYGSGRRDQGTIPDWKPVFFDPADVEVPAFLPDTPDVRADLAGQYTAANRMDQGLGIMLDLLREEGHENTTLVISFSDNGIPFPSGKTNLQFEQGHREPLVVFSPEQTTHGRRSTAVVSALDFVPTILQWAGLEYPAGARAGGKAASLSGSSLLPLLDSDSGSGGRLAFGSHSFHSLYAYYPSRTVRDHRYRLVHNLAPDLHFAILEDVQETDTWRRIENGSIPSGPQSGRGGWIYPLAGYMKRPEFQLFDLESDPLSLVDLAGKEPYAPVQRNLTAELYAWRQRTSDPWLGCTPARAGGDGGFSEEHSSICSF